MHVTNKSIFALFIYLFFYPWLDDAGKSKTMENFKSKNSIDNVEESLKTETNELKPKFIKPKLKVPDLKFKSLNPQSKNLSPIIKRLKTKPKLMDIKETETKLKKSPQLFKSVEMKENDDDDMTKEEISKSEGPKTSKFVKISKFPKFEKSLKPALKGLVQKNGEQSHSEMEDENKTLGDREQFRQNKYYNNVNLLNSLKNKNFNLSKTKSIENNKISVTNENDEKCNIDEEKNNSILKKYSHSFSKDKTENIIDDSNKNYITEKLGKDSTLKKGVNMMFKTKKSSLKSSFNNNSSKEVHDQKQNESIDTDQAEPDKINFSNKGNDNNIGDKINVLISMENKPRQIGPLTTYTESEILKNNNYMNAFSRVDGNYIGKVTGPPVTPLSMSDKIPQNESEKKCEYNKVNNIEKGYNDSNNNNRFVDNHLYASNFPIFFDPSNISWNNKDQMNFPFIFYPGFGFYSPVFSDGTCSYSPMMEKCHKDPSNNKNGDILDKENVDKERKNNKKKISNKNKDKTMIAGGHLKPLQFRNGAEWSSEDENLLNSDIAIYEGMERKIKKKEKGKVKERYIGDSKWYDIEHKLNNCRGVIESDNHKCYKKKKKKYSDANVNISCKSDTKYSNCEDEFSSSCEKTYLESDTKNDPYSELSSDEQMKYYNRSKRSSNKKKNSNKYLEDEYDFDFDDLYKNYKIEYLKDKLKWANEYLKKREEREKHDINDMITQNSNDSNIGNKCLKKSNIKNSIKGKKKNAKRLDDITHLFLPSPKKHENLFDLSLNFSKVDDSDKDDIINMLFLCRDLEKVIEEQHCILDMLDNDLSEVNNSLRLPPNWDNINNFEILQEQILNENDNNTNSLNVYDGEHNNGLALNNVPLFIKGKISLIPKNLNHFFDNNDQAPQTGQASKNIDAIKNKKGDSTYSTPPEAYKPTNKYMPKFVKARIKAKTPLLLKGG